MSDRLSNKVCIITGTGGSIGRAAALIFAREGASVVGCDVRVTAAETTTKMVLAQGGTMISRQPCRLTEPAECQALVDFAMRAYGRIAAAASYAEEAARNSLRVAIAASSGIEGRGRDLGSRFACLGHSREEAFAETR